MNVNSTFFQIHLPQKLFYSCKNICFEVIQNGSKSDSPPFLNRILSSNFWWLRSANHMKFSEESLIWDVVGVLVKINVFTWARLFKEGWK